MSVVLLAVVVVSWPPLVLLVVREVAGAIRTVAKVKRKVRLAAGLDADSRLSREAMERGWDCLRLFAEQLQDVPKENMFVGRALRQSH